MAVKSVPAEKKDKPQIVERFIRIIQVHPKTGDTFASFQPEIITIIDDQVVERKTVGTPNFFEYAQTKAADLIDPRNQVDA